ncbi:MAG TPA: hypothetical protein VHB21_04175, partial [Minicystis sp.]|nr:hypothetical protein [Minicystis sp.]
VDDASQDGDLPPGHPSVDGAASDDGDLPPGHPRVGGDDGDDPHAASPHGKSPHGTSGEARLFNPPADTSQDDASLPAGVVVVSIKDAHDVPIAHAPVTLGVLHASVAKGESRERLAKETDAQGEARFEGLQFGSGTTYRVSTTRGAASYAVMPFSLGDKVGKRAVLHAYDATGNVDELLLGAQAVIYVALREDAIQVEQLVTIYDMSPTSWIADSKFALPAGFKAFNKQESMDDARVEEVSGEGAALRGTFAPGRHDVDFRYQVPLDDKERQTLRIALPPHVAQARVMVEASRSMGLEVPGFPPPERTTNRDGKRLLVTEKGATRGEGGVRTLEITLTGLPTPGPGRWVAVVLAALAVAAGLSAVFGKKGDGLDAEARKDLEEAREALLGEVVTLERMHKQGEIGPKTYARVRGSLLDALARVVEQIERADAAAKPKPRGRPASSAARRPA